LKVSHSEANVKNMAIVLKGIEKVYHSPRQVTCALKNVSLKIEEGESFGILGSKKSGKTTLLRCINLVETPTSGSLTVASTPITGQSSKNLDNIRRSLSYMMHPPLFMNTRTLYENIALPLEMTGKKPMFIRESLNSLLTALNLQDWANVYPYQASLFLKQRASFARALSTHPKILLCDDPTAGMDHKSLTLFLQMLQEMQERYKFTLIIATDELEVIKALCKRMGVLHHGQIAEQGTVANLLATPQSAVTKEFIKTAARGEMPANLRRRLKATPGENLYPILRLSFLGSSLQEPALTEVIRNFGLSINILQAHLETLVNQTLGVMVMEMRGEHEPVHQAIRLLEEKGLNIEVLGYVPATT